MSFSCSLHMTMRMLIAVLTLGAVSFAQEFDPPKAKIIPTADTMFGDIRIDNYAWLRQRNSPEVLKYLEAENDYTSLTMKPTEELQQKLYDEMLSRIKETDLTPPVKHDDYIYYTRTEEGKPYEIHCRKKGSLDASEEIILDENAFGEGLAYFAIGVKDVSPNHQVLAFSTDTNGSERYNIRIRDLSTGEIYPEVIPNTAYSSAWATDNKTFFYTTQDELARAYRLYRHTLGTDPSQDKLIYEERDTAFSVYIKRTKDDAYLLMELTSLTSSEVYYLDAGTPSDTFTLIEPRRMDIQYHVYHHDNRFFILTNDSALNFRVVTAPVADPSAANWKDLVPHIDSVYITSIEVFANWLVAFERVGGLEQVHVHSLVDNSSHYISFPEPVYTLYESDNPEFETETFRFGYSSMVTPKTIYDYHMSSRERKLLKQTEVPGYDPSLYTSERIFARAADGAMIPISLVYKRGIQRNGKNPFWLYGYGAYGLTSDPYFSASRMSLVDRGFIYAIAHIRGGSEMGRQWYFQGRLLNKKNTFTDFIACAEHVIAEGYTSSDQLVISGGSAGGLLIGAVVNMRPDLFKAAIAGVPFVDVMNTMLDPSIPLTVEEFVEWGNPMDSVYYTYMRSYSPYDNVEAKEYPNMLIIAGLNDPRVQYWEPAKWTASLRATKTDDNRLLLKTHMGSGHFGLTGRYGELKEQAFMYAFALDILGLRQQADR